MSSPCSAVQTPAVVLDTNATLDWLVFGDTRIQALADAVLRQRIRWLATALMELELVDVLSRPRLTKDLSLRERALTGFRYHADLRVEPPRAPATLTCADPADQVFIDLAVAQGARWLITRDKALLALRRRALPYGVAIGTPAEWREG